MMDVTFEYIRPRAPLPFPFSQGRPLHPVRRTLGAIPHRTQLESGCLRTRPLSALVVLYILLSLLVELAYVECSVSRSRVLE